MGIRERVTAALRPTPDAEQIKQRFGDDRLRRLLPMSAEYATTRGPARAAPRTAPARADTVEHSASPLPVNALAGTLWEELSTRPVLEKAFHAKLSVSQPLDSDELEADQVGSQVMRMPEPPNVVASGGMSSCSSCMAAGTNCSTCAAQSHIHRAAAASTKPPVTSAGSPVAALRGGGQPLSRSERAFFEPRLDHDFSAVRIHIDAAAGKIARSINARAFTSGNSIAFAPGEFRQDFAGRTLLAHELAHVVQNAGGTDGTLKRQGDAGVADAGGAYATQTRVFNGVTLSDDPAYAYDLLKRIFLNSGYWAMQDFVFSFESDVSRRRPIAGVSEDPELNRDITILSVLRQQYQILTDDGDSFIAAFETRARQVAMEVVEDSEKIVRAEAARYGIRNLRLEFSTWLGIPEIHGDVADNASTRGLAIAARGLLDRKNKAEAAMARYQEFTHGAPAFAELASQRFHSQEDEIAKGRAAIFDAQKDLDVFRVQVQMRYPLLAALSSDEDFKRDDLEALAAGREGPTQGGADVVVAQIIEKLGNIEKVKKDLKPGGDINVWLVPKLVAATRDKLGVAPGTLHAHIVDAKVKEEQPSTLTGILIGILQLGLVLLAPFTEGLTLIPAAALSAHTAYEHFKEYETKSALRGTHFGAGALSAEEPSLFWLAVDIVGAGFDVGAAGGAAFRIFRELAPAAKALRAGEITEDAARNIERQASELGGKKLGEAIGRDVRALRSGTKEVGMTAEEARQFEQAGKELAEQAAKEVAEETIAGGRVTVSRSGAVWSCQSPCMMMRERFKDLLAREPKYLKKLEELEERAARLPKAGAEADLARKELAKEAAALEREMRTTSLPGDWTSPLAPQEIEELKYRRGSVAAQLDHHPPGWTGKEEARFRYGMAKGEEAEAGYRWTLDENGALRYERMERNLPPRRYNPASGEFEPAAEEGFIAAQKGAEKSTDFAKLPKSQHEAMKEAFKRRRKLIDTRDKLELLQEQGKIKPKELEDLKKLYAQIHEQSRQLGEHAAEALMSGKGKKLYPLGKTHSTSGDFDQVWKVGDEFHIVEAKGGSSGLGSRQVGEGLRAEQGTIEYAKSIIDNMVKNGATPEIRKLGRELEAALANGKVKYVLVRAPVGMEGGNAVLRDVWMSEFVLPEVK